MSNLQFALETAIAAALAAGERLRTEFLQPGGPRGGGEKADIDEEVERDIRGRLIENFPDWSYRGEETGSSNLDSEYRWLVDPNDGTATFLKGVRGFSVSIALLFNSEPVLGVVYAPLYPDNEGDLLAWAQGCGPVRRNGHPLDVPVWPDRLRPEDVVMVSFWGEASVGAHLQCVRPARYRCMPSAAYRLALVAAGEAVAGNCLGGAQAHDFAAAHALLKGQGGDLFDIEGKPVVYDPRGQARPRYCFGGGAKVCRELALQPWNKVYGGVSEAREGLPYPILSKKGRAVSDGRLLTRGLGLWFGQLCGDSLGSLVEFESPETIRAKYPKGPCLLVNGGTWNTLAGQPTDDSEMALCLARSLAAQGGYNRDAVWKAYHAWADSSPFDIGMTTSAALVFTDPPAPGRHSDSQANGALMRCCALALAGWHNVDELMDWSDQDASLTHSNAVCLAANRAYLRALAKGLSGGDPQDMFDAARAGSEGPVQTALEAALSGPPGDFMTHMGWVLVALQNAFYRLLHSKSLYDGVVETVRAGGDTDTNGCIAGALLGAYHGVGAIPAQWRLAVLSCRPHSESGAKRVRPPFLWPVDVYPLVEKLLTRGRS